MGKPKTFPDVWAAAPEELTREKLVRLGEGIGKVVYASEHWVVKRKRSPREVLALIYVWKLLRRIERFLPWKLGQRLLNHPSHQIRLLRVVMQAIMRVLPGSLWYTTHLDSMWRLYRKRDLRGERLADTHLAGTRLVPRRIEFPPVRVQVGGWPGVLTVSEATERVETTLYHRISQLAQEKRYDELEQWLNRFLDLRKAGWSRGLFSVDAHLKNFGVTADRVVLLDAGGLTDKWSEVESRLERDEELEPHVALGLEEALRECPEAAAEFNRRWRAVVNPATVKAAWATGQRVRTAGAGGF